MNADKKLSELLEDYNKPLKKLFKYDKSKALTFDKETRSEVQEQKGIFVIFKNKKPLYVGQAGGFMTGYKLTQKDLNDKLAQFNVKSDAGTAKFRKAYVAQQNLDESELKNIKAEEHNLKFQYIKVKGNPALINILEILALEYAKENDVELYNFL
ncbi:hypothetical protein BUY79_07835 [Staphylococcus equorum]|uniref:hypothetical protein n=1 Tax=Staphylococcus equorum TaxID=246432 RepID=UPI000D1C3F78|nr:hypothetical protein [Staphylococcus equorum]PTE44460.1 hypothetical protein BUY77_00185 [Staphylococcus equorum]PTE83815.1 hypothetical protein BUY79_07835 [Staphylococcus equorum]PTF11533.1 hypothetical protein BUY81_05750 [Staphylococcus equorum]RIL50501.1 hypothetical protein BUY82_00490 [Staphylococcus equorum]